LHYRKAIAVMRSATCEVGSWQRVRREFAIRLPVLRYRHVNSAERFEAQVRWLSRRGYVGIAPSQWLAWVTMGAELPERPVLIAFEAAYADVADIALPILRRYSFSAAVHVVTGHIGGESKWDREEGQLPERLMTADQIVHWSSQGIEFGSASRTHRNLTDLDNETLAGEIEGSATDLEQVLGRRPCSFLYPYGAVNQAAFEQVRRSFEIGLGAVPGLNALSTNLHLMHTAEIKLSQRIVSLAYAVMFGRPTLLPLHEGDSFNASDTFEQHPGTFTRKVEI
jgi:peptidoglycan/xylan/chitin deacetylase (PgdA/CDA1 family)